MRPLLLPVQLVVVLVLAACGGSSNTAATTATTATGVQGPSEVQAEPVDHAGDNPFTPSVGKDRRNARPPKQVARATAPTAYRGSLPGLYGGTMDYSTCDKGQLVTFLRSEPAKASAWAQTLNITTSQIPTFVDDLTAVTLRTDVRVTNHGFVDGVANPIQSVLQAGTAVLVDRYGRPVVKCYCGNPLTAPLTYTRPVYTGPVWPAFQPTSITIINQSTTVINVFKLYDPDTGRIFARPAGTDGTRDKPYYGPGGSPKPAPQPPQTPTVQQPTTATPPSTPTTEQPPAAVAPSAAFDPQVGSPQDTYTLYVSSFEPNASLTVDLTRPDGVHETYRLQTGSDGTGNYTFPHNGDPIPGTYRAVITNPATGTSTSASTTVSG